MDAYRKGLTGEQATWAAEKYRGHRCVSDTILAEYDASQATKVQT
jgi:hypothetical protein